MVQVVVAYDISNDKRRNKVAKCLQGYGERVNFSIQEIPHTANRFYGTLSRAISVRAV